MTSQPGGTRGFGQRMGAWLYRVVFLAGWRRWAALVAALLLLLLAVLVFTSRTDYREDPSALTPRSVEFYAEARELDTLFRTVGDWTLWTRGGDGLVEIRWNKVQQELATIIGDEVEGLGDSKPILWLSSASRAAYCVAPADENEGESWALFLNVPQPMTVMAELGIERGLSVTQGDDGVYALTGRGEGVLYFAVVDPWLVISSSGKLPKFAIDSLRTPAVTLAYSGILPKWRRGADIRGVLNPHYRASHSDIPAYAIVSSWMAPDIRINFSTRVGKSGGMETYFNYNVLSERVKGSGVWPLILLVTGVVALGALVIVIAILLTMIGWGGWLKMLAARAGIRPASAPSPVHHSTAFREDAGLVEQHAEVVVTLDTSSERADVGDGGNALARSD
ncbi:MAG: hypothetical protein LIP18_06775, partial [Planctomycetes bacterium]|nr:hypothetical protein [Planctomycetota bacterium]